MVFENLGLSSDEKYIKYGDFKYESGYKFVKEFLSVKFCLDVIFCLNDEMVIGVCDVVKEFGFLIFDEFGVMGFDDIELFLMVMFKIIIVY